MSDIDIKFGEHKSYYEELQKELKKAKSDLFAKEIEIKTLNVENEKLKKWKLYNNSLIICLKSHDREKTDLCDVCYWQNGHITINI